MNILFFLTGINIFVLIISVLLVFKSDRTLNRVQENISSTIGIIINLKDELQDITVILERLFKELTGEVKMKREGTI